VQLNDEKDIFVWGLTNSGQYTVNSLYLDLINDDTKYLKKYIWKMKVLLKIKIFMWFLDRKEILTKDNIIWRNWVGRESCCFCDGKESMQHLFFDCPFTKIIWRIIHMTFGLSPPKNITNLFVNWLKGIPKKELIKIRVGVCAVIWTTWNIRNVLSLTNQKNLHFCRLSLWSLIESVCGPISNKRRSRWRWLLGATFWRPLLGIYSTSAACGCLIELLSRCSNLAIFFDG
jgi:hypothetical protein